MSASLRIDATSRPVDSATSALAPWAPLLLRAVVGFGLVMHGYAKLARGPDTFAVVLHTLGVPLPGVLAWLTTCVELIGGLAVLAGAFLPIVSIPLALVLLTAMFTVHRPYGFFSVKLLAVTSTGTTFGPVGYEITLLYLAGLGALALGGAGPLSVDRWRARALARRRTGSDTLARATESIEVHCDESGEIDRFLGDRIYEFNAGATARDDGELFAVTRRDAAGAIVAGASGYTWGGCCYVAHLWVSRPMRARGLGAAILLAVEDHAMVKGCAIVLLASHSFQAPAFYEKMGYVRQAEIADHPVGHSSIFFAKRLRLAAENGLV